MLHYSQKTKEFTLKIPNLTKIIKIGVVVVVERVVNT